MTMNEAQAVKVCMVRDMTVSHRKPVEGMEDPEAVVVIVDGIRSERHPFGTANWLFLKYFQLNMDWPA